MFAREAKKLKAKIGKKHIKDRDYQELAERVCNPYKDEGLWITTYDLVKEPPKLSMVSMGDLGKCRRECETIAFTCKKVLYNSVAEILDVIESNEGKIDGKELNEVLCEQPCEKERHDVMATSKVWFVLCIVCVFVLQNKIQNRKNIFDCARILRFFV